MNPKYVPSLKLCKQLKENGWKKETLFWWIIETENLGHWCNDVFTKDRVSAPLSDEILEELPSCKIKKIDNRYFVKCYPIDYVFDKLLSNALAKLWLYLKKEGIIK